MEEILPVVTGLKRARSSSSSDCSNSSDNNRSHRSTTKLSSVLVKPYRNPESDHEEERKTIIESQRSNEQIFNRNKRMFGMLIGTLKQFKKEESGREEHTSRRNRFEDTLTVIEDRRPSRRETNQASEEKSEDEEEIQQPPDKAELRTEITNQFTNWEINHRRLCNFIRTETKPKIFWLPKEHNPLTERRLKETRDYYSLYIAEKAAKLKKELADLEDREEPVTR